MRQVLNSALRQEVALYAWNAKHCFDHALDSSAWPLIQQHREDTHRRPAQRKPAPEPLLEFNSPGWSFLLASLIASAKPVR